MYLLAHSSQFVVLEFSPKIECVVVVVVCPPNYDIPCCITTYT